VRNLQLGKVEIDDLTVKRLRVIETVQDDGKAEETGKI
jgi:hypothetical protein